MSLAFEIALLALAAMLAVPVLFLSLQTLFAALPYRPRPVPQATRPALAVLIPAHDEALGIGATLEALRGQLLPGDRVLVVADNCADDTAAVVRAAGFEAVERHDTSRRGKGYALDFGVRHLVAAPPQLVLIVDADCEVEPGVLDRLARECVATGRPVQARYLMRPPKLRSPAALIASFAWLVRNEVRPRGSFVLGFPCHLMGTGMAFPWAMLQAAPLVTGHIVEDMQLGIDLARAGTPAIFCPEAVVWSTFPVSQEGTQSQRKRWEHGHLGMIAGEAPRLVLQGLRGRGRGLVVLALDMAVPPLALFTLLIVALWGLAALFAALGGAPAPLAAMSALASLFGASVLLAWLRFGRDTLSFATLLMALVYALRKIPLYIGFFIRRQAEWVRSKRDGE
jgi:cellulose synthase/poly-beta-1,6-N-acetylglucosamine synthase-like glycosyltransferase